MFLMNAFLFFRYGNRMLFFFLFSETVKILKTEKQSTNMTNIVLLSPNQIADISSG